MNKLKIAIQSKGRLSAASITFLQSLGLDFAPKEGSLVTSCRNADIDIFFLRSNDIPEYVSSGVADFGITGENVLQEKRIDGKIIQKLGFARCRLVIAIPQNSPLQKLSDLEGERIATSYTNLLAGFLGERGIHAAIVPISGSVEVTPEMGLADAICDITQTGNTLRAHRLREFTTIMESEAVLIESPFANPRKAEFLEKL